MVDTYALYRRLAAYPTAGGSSPSSSSRRRPTSSRPRFVELRPHYAELRIAKRRRVQNHIGTVHVIAICNGLEAAMGAGRGQHPAGPPVDPKGMAVDHREGDE